MAIEQQSKIEGDLFTAISRHEPMQEIRKGISAKALNAKPNVSTNHDKHSMPVNTCTVDIQTYIKSGILLKLN